MSLRVEIRAALAERPMDGMELLKACPSAKGLAQLTNNLHQLAHEGKIVRTHDSREYVLNRKSGRTREHAKATKLFVWRLGAWADPTARIALAENMPAWIMRRAA